MRKLKTGWQRFGARGDDRHVPTGERPAMPLAESGARYDVWLKQLRQAGLLSDERLLPLIEVDVPNTLPDLMARGVPRPGLVERVKAHAPWGYSIQLAPNVLTGPRDGLERMIYRSHLIGGAIAEGMRRTSVEPGHGTAVDFACNHGYFTLLAAEMGCGKAVGFDLRDVNVAKARLLAEQYGHNAVRFEQRDVYDYAEQADVVLNLGLLYHVTDPVRLLQLTFDACGRFAIVDTITHKAPVSAFILRTNKNNRHHAEGSYTSELHPTYRALIDLMHAVGFTDLHEVVPKESQDRARHDLYERFTRRCVIGFRPGARAT